MTTYGKIALFVGGTLFGSAGFKLLGSKDAKKVYAQVTAAALRCKDEVMRNVELVQEGWASWCCITFLSQARKNGRRPAPSVFPVYAARRVRRDAAG